MKRLRAYISASAVGLILFSCAGRSVVAQVPDARAIAMPIEGAGGSKVRSVAEALQGLAEQAGVIFVGRVERVEVNGGSMEINFSVQKSVRGDVSESYTLREWAGRWAAGQQHYRVGQRALVFLYAPSAAGLSSPVDGMAGIVPVVPMGADSDPLLDVRWLATRVERPVGAPITDAEFGAVALAEALAVVQGPSNEPIAEPVKRPLPIGLRPVPVRPRTPVIEEGPQADPLSLPAMLQGGAADVEP